MDAASIRFAACNICDEASGFNGNWKIEAGLAVFERLSHCQFRDPNGWGQPFYNFYQHSPSLPRGEIFFEHRSWPRFPMGMVSFAPRGTSRDR